MKMKRKMKKYKHEKHKIKRRWKTELLNENETKYEK